LLGIVFHNLVDDSAERVIVFDQLRANFEKLKGGLNVYLVKVNFVEVCALLFNKLQEGLGSEAPADVRV